LKDQWVGNNVELSLLSQRVEQFFVENQFETELEQTQDKDYVIKASDSQIKLKVNIRGRPSDFTVEFVPSKKTRGFSLSMLLGYITASLGGGILVMRDLKLQEITNKLEKVFWDYMDIQVAELNNSAKTT
jgi:hypothetical protein